MYGTLVGAPCIVVYWFIGNITCKCNGCIDAVSGLTQGVDLMIFWQYNILFKVRWGVMTFYRRQLQHTDLSQQPNILPSGHSEVIVLPLQFCSPVCSSADIQSGHWAVVGVVTTPRPVNFLVSPPSPVSRLWWRKDFHMRPGMSCHVNSRQQSILQAACCKWLTAPRHTLYIFNGK